MVRFTRAKYYTRCGPVCRPTQAKWVKRTSCDSYNFADFRPGTFILGTYTAQCMYSMKIISVFHLTNFVIFWQFSPTSPPKKKFPSFSHVAILRACVLLRITMDIQEPLYITQKLTLTVKRIPIQNTVWEDAWVDGVICRPSLSHSVKECGQHLRPLPASTHPEPQRSKLA